MDQGQESGEHGFSRDESPAGEAWQPEDEAGRAAWDDGSKEIWDEAEPLAEGAGGEGPDGEEFHGQMSEEESANDERHTALPPKVEAWRKRSATGAVLTGFAFGLQQVFEPREEAAVIMETSGEPPKDLPVEADLEYGRPRHSVVNIRPWLLQDDGLQGEDEPDLQPSDSESDAEQPEPDSNRDETPGQNGSGS